MALKCTFYVKIGQTSTMNCRRETFFYTWHKSLDIGDPANYVLPDVNCDFTKVTMTQTDDKNVKIQGAIGKPPTETFKVSATYMDGFKATCVSIINGGQAGAKAHAVANAILDRSRWFSVGI